MCVRKLYFRRRKLYFRYSFWNFRFQIEKRKLEFHYSFWNFRCQIEKLKFEFHYSFCNLRSQIKKPKSNFSLFDLENCEANTQTFHSAFWNFTPKSKTGSPSCTIRSGTRLKSRSRSSTFRFGSSAPKSKCQNLSGLYIQARKNRPVS